MLIVAVVITALTLILAAPMIMIAGALPQETLSAPQWVLVSLIVVAALAVSFGYFPWFWARSGSTPGMRLTHLKVVRDADGGKVSGGQALLRLVGYWISAAVMYLGFAWILIDGRHRGWARPDRRYGGRETALIAAPDRRGWLEIGAWSGWQSDDCGGS